jgi:hypothetical protein
MRDLACGVDAGVGAARAANSSFLAREFKNGCFQRALHGDADRLRLPADEGRPVVFD